MLVRQCKDTFIRKYGDVGYITSQLTKHDRVYDSIGALFLEKISRVPRSIDQIIDEMHPLFIDVSKDTLQEDFSDFVTELEKHTFLVCGNSVEELDRKEPSFSYQMENPKTVTYNFIQQDMTNSVRKDTADFFYEHFRNNPTIFGMQIEVTSRCNEQCLHCYIPNENKTTDIEFSLALDVLDQLKDMGTVSVSFSGGELFLHPQIKDILRRAKKNDFMITILSNVTLLDDDLIDVLKELNISLLQVSLYSMNAEEHDAITKLSGSFVRTMAAIEKLLASDIPIQISCPVMKINKDSYTDVLAWATQRKMKAYTDFIMMARTDFTTSNLDHRLNLEETEELINVIINEDEGYRAMLELEPKSKDLERYAKQPVCGVGIDNLCMAADGNLYPCSGFQGYALGNAYKQSMRDVWENSEGIKYLRSIMNSSFPQCLSCNARDYCAMCLVRNFNESGGDIFKLNDHFCQVAFLNKRLVEEYKLQREGTYVPH